MLFALKLKWLPTGGRSGVGDTGLWGNLQYLIMPAFCLAIGLIAYLMRVTRNSMLDVMSRDYVKTARAKGESERVIFYKHCFRNGCTPVLILLISRFSFLVAGTTVIETVFNYPGMGLLLITAITDANGHEEADDDGHVRRDDDSAPCLSDGSFHELSD